MPPARSLRILPAMIVGALTLGWSASCTEPSPESGTAAVPRAGRARVVGGLILRDPATKRAIRETSNTRLPSDAGDSLELVVSKSRYRLDVVRDGTSLKTYPVALGDAPEGPKRVEGDERTPEGRYVLIPHHPSPTFGDCFYVCYPNTDDADRGLADGSIDRPQHARITESLATGARPPQDTGLGGLILLHGTRDRSTGLLTKYNWTDGCIAMENRDLLELLDAFEPQDRPILDIRP